MNRDIFVRAKKQYNFLIVSLITAVFYAQGPHFVLKALPYHAQGLCAFGNIVVVGAQNLQDHLAFKLLSQIFKGVWTGWVPGLIVQKCAAGSAFFQLCGQKLRCDERAVIGRQQNSADNDVLELTDIAGPVVIKQKGPAFLRKVIELLAHGRGFRV